MKSTLLFSEYDLSSVLEGNRSSVRDASSNLDQFVLLNSTLEEAAQFAVGDLQIEPITLIEDDISVEKAEAKVDVSRDPMRYISDRSRPCYVDGIKVTYHLPFSGDRELFRCRPNRMTLSPPRAVISSGELLFEFSVTDGDIAKTKPMFASELAKVREWVGWQRSQIDVYNSSLAGEASRLLEERLVALKKSQSQFSDLGYKVHTKADSRASMSNKSPTKAQKTTAGQVASQTFDVALSFAGEDREYVDQVAVFLRAHNVAVFYDKFEAVDLWGRNLVDHLAKVYEHQSRFIVMFISEHYGAKSWPNHERKSAQSRAVKMQEDCILPARFDDTVIEGMPESVSYVDLKNLEPKELGQMILEKLKG